MAVEMEIPQVNWPEALPHPEENYVISLVLDKDSIHWAFHSRAKQNFTATFFWRTNGSVLSQEGKDYPSFNDLVPKVFLKTFRGPDSNIDIQTWSNIQRIPTWTVYVILQPGYKLENTVQRLFEGIPCRLFQCHPQDFGFSPAAAAGISATALASLRGILDEYMRNSPDSSQSPSILLLWNVRQGQNIQYLAYDGSRKLFGGGKGPTFPTEGIRDIFSASPASTDSTSYLALHGIVRGWEQKCNIVVDRSQKYHPTTNHPASIWIDGNAKESKGLQKLLVQGKITSLPLSQVHAVRYYAHTGIDTLLQSKLEEHGELTEPLHRLIVGQRVQRQGCLGTVVKVSSRETVEPSDYSYVVRYDGSKQPGEVVPVQDIPAAIDAFIQYAEDLLKTQESSPSSQTEGYHKQLRYKIKTQREVKEFVEKELQQYTKKRPREQGRPINEDEEDEDEDKEDISPESRALAESMDPESARKKAYVGLRVAKDFGDEIYYGTIMTWDPASLVSEGFDLWRVMYDDSDQEDFDEAEVKEVLAYYEQNKANDKAAQMTNKT